MSRSAADDLHSAIRQTEVSVNNGPWMALDLIDADDGIYAGQLSFLDDGSYQLRARALDQWDNFSETLPRRFRVDRSAPVISISGVRDGGQYAEAVTPVIAIDEANPAMQTITLDGASFTSGTTSG